MKEFEDLKALNGLKIGQTFKGEIIDYPGYEFQITGGSDNAGFAMRKDINNNARAKILANILIYNYKKFT
jgi:small subunit ribosomal protein S6e